MCFTRTDRGSFISRMFLAALMNSMNRIQNQLTQMFFPNSQYMINISNIQTWQLKTSTELL